MLELIRQKNDEVECKTNEENSHQSKVNGIENENYVLKRDVEKLDHDNREANGLHHKNNMEIARLRDISSARDLDNKSYLNRIETMEKDIDQNEKRIAHLNEAKT